MKTHTYIWMISLAIVLTIVISAFAACGGRDTSGVDTKADSVSINPPDNANNYTVNPPPGDTNAMIRDSLYNADSTHKK